MRLIDADALIEQLRAEDRLTYLVKGAIDNQPTAYDVDAVVEKIGNISEPIRPVGWSRKIEAVETKAVFDIVRSGGKE